jgi:hypothetical protein
MIRLLTLDEVDVYIQGDPVRPHLSAEFRTTNGRQVWGLFEDQYAIAHTPITEPLAVICVAYTNAMPTNEIELDWFSSASGSGAVTTNTVVFYTVWSYSKGAGQIIVNTVAEHIKNTRPEVSRWVTLSPLTTMAERFHIKNGAQLHSVYDTAQIFEYTHLMQAHDSEKARSALR